MANGYYKSLYDMLFKGGGVIPTSQPVLTETEKTQKDLQTKINNANTKLASQDLPTVEADDRNAVEKFLGLNQNQGLIGDIFEVINKPQQALFGAIKAYQEGEDVGEGAWKHFKGDEETAFKDILMNTGAFKDEKGKLNWVDTLGFVGDVLLDPVDLALIPVTGGASAIASAVDATGDVAKGVKTASKVASAVDTAGDAIQGASKVANVVDTASDAGKVVSAIDNANSAVKFKSLSDLAFEGLGKGIKGAAKITDTGIEKTLKYLDEVKGVDNGLGVSAKIGYTNLGSDTAAGLGKYLRNSDEYLEVAKHVPKGRLEKYKEIKETITNLFKVKNGTKKAIKVAREADFIEDTAKTRMGAKIKEYDDAVAKFSKKSKMSVEDVNNAMTDVKEHLGLNRNFKGSEVLKSAREGVLRDTKQNRKILDELASSVNKADRFVDGEAFRLGYTVDDNGIIKLDGNWKKKVLDGMGLELNEEALNKTYKLGTSYTKEQLKYLKNLENNEQFMKFFNKYKNLDVELNKILDESFGSNLVKKYGDNAGYVPHMLKNKYDKTGILNDLNEDLLKGNLKTLSDRKRLGSVLEENNLYNEILSKNYDSLSDAKKSFVDKNKGLFERNYSAAMSKKFLDDMPTLLKNNKVLTESLIDQSFDDIGNMIVAQREIKEASLAGNKKMVSQLSDAYNAKYANSNIQLIGSNGKAPIGFTKMSNGKAKYYANKLDEMAKQLGNGDIKKFTNQLREYGDDIAIDSQVLDMITILDNKKEVNALGGLYDKYLNFYKGNKLLSPTYLLNNFTGNASNMYLSGISVAEQAKYAPDAYRVISQGNELYLRRLSGEVLSKSDNYIADVYEKLGKAGFGKNANMAADLYDVPESIAKYMKTGKKSKNLGEDVVKFLPKLNAKMNESMDTMSRAIVLMKGLDDPSYLRKLGVNDAMSAVKKVMFDPSELTAFEKNYVKRIVPFYTFAKKNLAYQIDNLGRNGNRYNKLMKAINSLQESATGGNEENMADYLKNNLYIPIPVLNEDGSYTMIRTQLPFGNLIDIVDDPLGGVVNLLGPTVKAPFEIASNTNIFTGQPLESFPGQKSKNIPFLSKKAEYGLSTATGLDVPLKTGYNIFSGVADAVNNDGTVLDAAGNVLNNTLTIQANVETDKTNRMYDHLTDVENAIAQYEQQGYEFSTINELKKAQQSQQKSIDAINAMYFKTLGDKPKDPYQAYNETLEMFESGSESSSEDLWKYFGIE